MGFVKCVWERERGEREIDERERERERERESINKLVKSWNKIVDDFQFGKAGKDESKIKKRKKENNWESVGEEIIPKCYDNKGYKTKNKEKWYSTKNYKKKK